MSIHPNEHSKSFKKADHYVYYAPMHHHGIALIASHCIALRTTLSCYLYSTFDLTLLALPNPTAHWAPHCISVRSNQRTSRSSRFYWLHCALASGTHLQYFAVNTHYQKYKVKRLAKESLPWKTHGCQCWRIRNHRIVSVTLRCWSGTSTSSLPKLSLGNTRIPERLRCWNSLQTRVSNMAKANRSSKARSRWSFHYNYKRECMFNQQNIKNTECSWFMHIQLSIHDSSAKLFTLFVLLPPRLLWSLDRLTVAQSCFGVTKELSLNVFVSFSQPPAQDLNPSLAFLGLFWCA